MLPRPGPTARTVKRQVFWDGEFVDLVKQWKWHVEVRYPFGPFAPRRSHRSFWRRADAEAEFLNRIPAHSQPSARSSAQT